MAEGRLEPEAELSNVPLLLSTLKKSNEFSVSNEIKSMRRALAKGFVRSVKHRALFA